MRKVAFLLFAAGAVPAAVQAQACLGQAPWSSGKMKVGGSLEFDGGTTILGGIGTGKDEGLFLGAGAGVVSYGGGAGSQVLLTAGVGKELSNKLADKIAICPVVNAEYGLKKNDFSFLDVMGGLYGGYPLATNAKNMNIILTGGGQVGFSHGSVTGVGGSTDFVGVIDFGAGFIFSNRISLVPMLRIYFGGGSTDAAFNARVNVAVGK